MKLYKNCSSYEQCIEQGGHITSSTESTPPDMFDSEIDYANVVLIIIVVLLILVLLLSHGEKYIPQRYRHRFLVLANRLLPLFFSEPLSPIVDPTPTTPVTPPATQRPTRRPPQAPQPNRQRNQMVTVNQGYETTELTNQPPPPYPLPTTTHMPTPVITPVEETNIVEPVATSTPIAGQEVEVKNSDATKIQPEPVVKENDIKKEEQENSLIDITGLTAAQNFNNEPRAIDNTFNTNETRDETANNTTTDNQVEVGQPPANNSILDVEVANLVNQLSLGRLSEEDEAATQGNLTYFW